MPKTINGKEVLETLSVFKEPVTLDEIVGHMVKTYSEPEEKVRKLVQDALDGGVRYGFVEKHNQFYFRVCDAIDAIDERSDEDLEDDEVESAESLEDVDSGEILPQTNSKKYKEVKSDGGRVPSRHPSQSKQVNKRDQRSYEKSAAIYSADEDDEDDYANEYKCGSGCNGSHRRQSADGYRCLEARSRSASRHR